MTTPMKVRTASLLAMLAAASLAQAHFVFVVPDAGGGAAKVFMSETLSPDARVGMEMISGAKLSARTAQGQETVLTLTKGSDTYVVTFPKNDTRLIHGLVDLGLQQMGSAKQPYVLVYHPKTILGDAFDGVPALGDQSPVEIVPSGKPGAIKLQLLVQGKPLADSEITVILPDASQKKMKTDATGQTVTLTQSGRYGAWARYFEATPGERDGKPYAEVRHYATLIFDADQPASITASNFATMPQASSSFGAVVNDGALYVYGGHVAPTHNYSTDSVSGQFARLKLTEKSTDKTKWEQLPAGPAMQGMNLAAYQGKVYRIGGMTPRNKPGEKEAIFSVADCARFDPASNAWEALPPMPEPRSSHDVVVIGGKVIVTGGWTLKGADRTEWRDTLLMLDLNAAKPQWQSIPQPFKRRALIAAAFEGKMYVLGGMDDHGKIVREVAIYDPAANAWTKGPDLPGGEMNGFAPAACANEGSLYASVADGTLYRLNVAQQAWEKAGTATPRIAHRIAGDGKTILIIGGADKGRNLDLIEAIAVDGSAVSSR